MPRKKLRKCNNYRPKSINNSEMKSKETDMYMKYISGRQTKSKVTSYLFPNYEITMLDIYLC